MMAHINPAFGTAAVKNTELLQGKPVTKGEVIAVLENPEFIQLQQDYLDYKSQLVYLKEELERQNFEKQRKFEEKQ